MAEKRYIDGSLQVCKNECVGIPTEDCCEPCSSTKCLCGTKKDCEDVNKMYTIIVAIAITVVVIIILSIVGCVICCVVCYTRKNQGQVDQPKVTCGASEYRQPSPTSYNPPPPGFAPQQSPISSPESSRKSPPSFQLGSKKSPPSSKQSSKKSPPSSNRY